MTYTIQKPRLKTHTPPAKQWRNWYEAIAKVRYDGNGFFKPGDVFHGTDIWSSKEIAEQKAMEDNEREIREYGSCLCRYIGAEPVE